MDSHAQSNSSAEVSAASGRDIYFSFFMFTADLRPNDRKYTQVLIRHLLELKKMGYVGFDLHIASQPEAIKHSDEITAYEDLKEAFAGEAGLKDLKFTTNVGTTRTFDPTSPYKEQREKALAYLKSRVKITSILGGDNSIMAGPFLYPYGVFPIADSGEGIWSDALQKWMDPKRYLDARPVFEELAKYAAEQRVRLAIEPVKSWETPPPNMVSEVVDFLKGPWPGLDKDWPCGLTIDTAQVVMESKGPKKFKENVATATQQKKLHYVHISAPDRGAIADCWIPWDIVLGTLEPVYHGPYLIEIFNAIPPFDTSMRMARRRFWRPGENDPGEKDPALAGYSAYDIAEAALHELKTQIASFAGVQPDISPPATSGVDT